MSSNGRTRHVFRTVRCAGAPARRAGASRTGRVARRAAVSAVAVVTAATVLAACGSGGSGSEGKGDHSGHHGGAGKHQQHNAQDVSFAQQMIPHHRQAVTMAGLAPSHASSKKVKDLAADIKKAQAPEVERMSGWLRDWKEKVPGKQHHMAGMNGMSHSSKGSEARQHSGHADSASGMPGMMDERQMKDLGKAHGVTFDRAFLTMMVGHHEGAVKMARAEKSRGAYGSAKKLAGSVIASQSAEIKKMKKMLDK